MWLAYTFHCSSKRTCLVLLAGAISELKIVDSESLVFINSSAYDWSNKYLSAQMWGALGLANVIKMTAF